MPSLPPYVCSLLPYLRAPSLYLRRVGGGAEPACLVLDEECGQKGAERRRGGGGRRRRVVEHHAVVQRLARLVWVRVGIRVRLGLGLGLGFGLRLGLGLGLELGLG